MIDITVKTLDSQNHHYSVPDDFTVRQFKDRIASSVAIPPDKQRLIYCGRVLQDEKKLSACDVNGKVIHLVQRPPPAPARPQNASGAQSTSSSSSQPQPQSVRQAFAQRLGNHDNNSFLLGAFTIPSEVMDPNQVQQIVQQVVSGMGDLGRNATVMSRTSDDGSTVDVHINLGQMPAHGDTHNRIKLVQSMIRRANLCLSRLENPNAAPSSSEEVQNEENTRLERGSTTSETQTGEAGAEREQPASENGSDTIEAEVFIQPTADNNGFASIATAAFAAASAYARSRGISPTTSPSNGSPTSSDAASQTQEHQTQTAQNTDSGTPQSQSSQNSRPSQPAVSIVHPPILATVLRELQGLQTRFQPFLNQYQELLQNDQDFQNNAEERGRSQGLCVIVSQILHYISHAYHAISDIMLDLNQAPPRTLRSRSMMHPPAAVVQAGFPVQAHINLSTTLNAARAAHANQNQANSNTAANPPSTNNANANSQTSGATDSTQPQNEQNQTPMNIPFLGSMGNPMTSLFSPSNPVVFMEVGPSSITIDSISATVATEAGGTPQPIRISGPRFPGMVFPQAPTQDFIQNLMQAVGQATTQRSANNGQSQARGNTATHPTTSTQTRSTSRPIQTIPLAFPGFPLVNFDPFLPCSSHHVARLARPVIPIRTQAQHQQQQQQLLETLRQGNAVPNASSDTQLAGMVANMMSVLFSHSNGSASNGTPSSSTSQGSARSTPQTSGVPRMLMELMNLWRTSGEATQSTTIADFLRTLPDYSYEEGEGLVSDLVMCVARHLSLREFIEVLFGRTEALDRLQATLREFVQTRVLHGGEPNETNIRAAVIELAAFMDVELRSVGDIEIKDGIDYLATMHNFYEQRLSSLINFILNPGEEGFGTSLYAMCRLIISEDIVLSIHCFRNGQQALERMVQNRVRRIASDLDPFIQHWMMNMCSAQIRSMIPNITVRQNDVLHYVVNSTPSAAAIRPSAPPAEQLQSQNSANTTGSVKPKRESVPLPAEPMELCSSNNDVEPGIVPTVEANVLAQVEVEGAVGRGIMEETVADLLSSHSAWTRAVSADWVPIIAEDVQRQRRQSAQRPFSDGYLGTMPSKRRKIMSNGRLRTVVDASSILPDTLRRAVTVAGVQPTTSLVELTHDVAANATLNSSFQEHLHNSISRRLNEDKDYRADKFPNAEVMFHCPRNGDNI